MLNVTVYVPLCKSVMLGESTLTQLEFLFSNPNVKFCAKAGLFSFIKLSVKFTSLRESSIRVLFPVTLISEVTFVVLCSLDVEESPEELIEKLTEALDIP